MKSRRILRLTKKYCLDKIQAHLIARLRSDWPKTLEEWDRILSVEDAIINVNPACTVDTWPDELLPEPVSAAILALEYGVNDVLPSIFYEMHRCYSSVDWDKLAETGAEFNIGERGARWDIATVEILQLRNIIREEGERKLIACLPSLMRGTGGHRYESECTKESHPSICMEIMLSSRNWVRALGQSRCPQMKSGLCSTCAIKFYDNVRVLRGDLWRFLVEMTVGPTPVP